MSEPKYAYRIPPCPDYDTAGMESWLEDMAARGYRLSKEGFFMGFAVFEETCPQRLKYRLEPAPKRPSAWSDSGGPDPAALELHRDFGWEYVAFRGQFHIYVTDDPAAPELNTDPQIHALSLKIVIKRTRSDFFSALVSLLITFGIGLFGKWASSLVILGPGMAAFFLLGIGWLDYQKVASWLHLRKLKKWLLSGQPLPHRTNYQLRAVRYRLYKICGTLISIALVICILVILFASPIGGEKNISLGDYRDGFPFATLQDIFPDAQLKPDTTWDNTVSVWSNAISDNYEYHEYADLTFPDGTRASAIFSVRYHATPFPALAKALVWEARQYGRQYRLYKPMDIVPKGVDYALAYENYTPHISFCKGGTMVETSLSLFTNDGSALITQKEFAQIMADSIG